MHYSVLWYSYTHMMYMYYLLFSVEMKLINYIQRPTIFMIIFYNIYPINLFQFCISTYTYNNWFLYIQHICVVDRCVYLRAYFIINNIFWEIILLWNIHTYNIHKILNILSSNYFYVFILLCVRDIASVHLTYTHISYTVQ